MCRIIDAPIRGAYRLAHGGLRAWWFLRRPETRGALVAVWYEGEILLLRSTYRKTVSLPGGYVKADERPIDAALRELREELGIEVEASELVHAYGGSHPFEHRKDVVDIFEYRPTVRPEVEANGREVAWVGFVSPTEALREPLVPHLIDYLRIH